MQRQQINLVSELSRPEKPLLPATQLLQLLLLFVMILLVFSAMAYTQLGLDKRRLQQLNQQQQAAQQSLVESSTHFPDQLSEPQLREKIAELKQDLSGMQQTYKKFARSAKLGGFAAHLQALSLYTPEDIWLQHIVIDTDKPDIRLVGNSLVAESVPVFVEALTDSEFFEHSDFQAFAIEQNEEGDYIHFSLGSLALELHPEAKPRVQTQAGDQPPGDDLSGDAPLPSLLQNPIDSIRKYRESEQRAMDLLQRINQGQAE